MNDKLQDLYYSAYRGCRNFWHFWRYDLHQGVGNLVRWFPIIWRDRDWDYCYLLLVMEKKLRRMADLQEKYGNGLHASRYSRQMRVAALLCKRIGREDSYSDNASAGYGYASRAWAKEWSNVVKQDKEMLGRLIGKYIDHWWD